MHEREKRALLREYLEQGRSKLGVSRRTVYHWINTGQLERDADEEAARYKARPVME